MCAIFMFLRLVAFVGNWRETQPLVEGAGKEGGEGAHTHAEG